MPLEMPEMDELTAKCGLPSLKTNGDGDCNKPGVGRIAVNVEGDEDDRDYKYTSQFRAVSYYQVMVVYCEDHKEQIARDFEEAKARVEARQDREAKAAAKIHEAKAAYEAAIADYLGTWCN